MIMASPISLVSPRFRRQQAMTKSDHRTGTLFYYLMGLVLLAFLCSLFYIWSRIQIVNVGYEINREVSLKEKLLEENKRLTLEMATLKSPVRLESLAKKEFRMDLPQKSQILRDGNIAPREEEVRTAKKTAVPLRPASKPATVASKMSPAPSTVQKSQATKASVSKVSPEKLAPKKVKETTVSAQVANPSRGSLSSRKNHPTVSEEIPVLSRAPKPQTKVVTLADLAEVPSQPRR